MQSFQQRLRFCTQEEGRYLTVIVLRNKIALVFSSFDKNLFIECSQYTELWSLKNICSLRSTMYNNVGLFTRSPHYYRIDR